MTEREARERLKQDVNTEFNRFFNNVLGLIEVLVKNDYQYSATRKKVLRYGNDALRDILREIDRYEIQRNPGAPDNTDVYEVN